MGLCKCPKKRVTQHFCFEHRVNVCEFCMVNAHPMCVVQPYLQWLEDSSFKTKCSLCQLNLANEECLRLLCYHIFHLSCLNKYGESFPPTTAPAGFTCPDCRSCIFPSSNSPSPIFGLIKKRLASADWARAGLGLPVLNATTHHSTTFDSSHSQSSPSNDLQNGNNNVADLQKSLLSNSIGNNIKIYSTSGDNNVHNNSAVPISVNQLSNYIHLNVDQNNSSYSSYSSSNRRLTDMHAYESDSRPLIVDIDEDKYRQKSAVERAQRYLKNNNINVRRIFRPKKFVTLGIAAFLLIVIIFYVLAHFAKQSIDDDPLLDPQFNPNIHNEVADVFR